MGACLGVHFREPTWLTCMFLKENTVAMVRLVRRQRNVKRYIIAGRPSPGTTTYCAPKDTLCRFAFIFQTPIIFCSHTFLRCHRIHRQQLHQQQSPSTRTPRRLHNRRPVKLDLTSVSTYLPRSSGYSLIMLRRNTISSLRCRR